MKYLDDHGLQTLVNKIKTVVSTSSNGLAPKVTNTNGFLRGDGQWVEPTATVASITNEDIDSIFNTIYE